MVTMTAYDGSVYQYVGLSTDDKPTDVYNGSVFLEIDTNKVYFYDEDGADWLEWGA